jgi:hypothetical protein
VPKRSAPSVDTQKVPSPIQDPERPGHRSIFKFFGKRKKQAADKPEEKGQDEAG